MNAARKLADLAEALKLGGALSDEVREQLSEAFDRITAGEPADVALGIRLKPGQRSLQYVRRHEHRNATLRETAVRFWPGSLPPEQARHIAEGLARYRSAGWRFDRIVDQCPARLLGTKQEAFFYILKQVDAALTVPTIRLILRVS